MERTYQDIIRRVKEGPSGRVKIAYTDIDGILRGKYISTEKFAGALESDTSFCDVIFGWDAGDVAYENGKFTGWQTGYPDTPCRIDPGTYRKIPWEQDLPFFLGEVLADVCPRRLLKKIAQDARDLGYTAHAAEEFEWFNFAETPRSVGEKQFRNLTPVTPGMYGYSILRSTLMNDFLSDLFALLGKFGIPLEGLHTETGPGAYEAAIQYAHLLEAGDRAVLFKTAVKEIAYKHGIMATFMAKIREDLPGCGGHVHQSLWDVASERNLFHDPADPVRMSNLMRQYIAGQLHCLPCLLPMYAPTINSYKRLVEGAWAPTTLTWGIDNRTVALRILNNGAKACRVETRVIGADANPYLAMAAAVGSGLYGIRHGLELKQPATQGNGYQDFSNGCLPRTLEEATQRMKGSPEAAEILGETFTAHFCMTREWEWKQHLKAVTDWEYRRYFEII